MNNIPLILLIIVCVLTTVPVVSLLFGAKLPPWAEALFVIPCGLYILSGIAYWIITKIAKRGV